MNLCSYMEKGPQEPEPQVSDDRSSECSTCQSNDGAGSIGTSSVHSVDFESEISKVPLEVYVSKPITTNEKVQLKTSRPNINSVRTNINTGRTNINSVQSKGTKACNDTGKPRMETVSGKDYILLPMWHADPLFSQDSKSSPDAGFKPSGEEEKKDVKDIGNEDSEVLSTEEPRVNQEKDDNVSKRKDRQDLVYQKSQRSLCIEFEKIMHKKFQMSSMGKLTFFLGLQVKQKEDEIFISQDKYMTDILKKFGFTDVKTASTPMETHKPLLKDVDGEDVDEHLYRFMIGSLMYLTSSRPNIMFAVCACARFQVNPKISHLHVVKRIFRYLKCQPKLGLWYPKDSPFDLMAYTNSDYAGASLDQKSTTGGCQFLGCRLISWQCKKQTMVANSITKAEYIAASNCCGQSTIFIVKNPVFHSKTNHIKIRHHFIRDSNEKKLIQMIKIHTDQNVVDLLTKALDVSRFQYLIASIGMLKL
ncbi:putative ribonuclease H-like domain-containing protein [Tanacetum coccineum]